MTESAPTTGKLAAIILAVVLVGTPLIAYLWGTANQLLSGHVEARRLVISLPVLLLLFVLLKWLARFVTGLDAERAPASSSEQTSAHGP